MKRLLALLFFAACIRGASAPEDVSALIQQRAINPRTPVVVRVHPAIATTVSFPNPIGEPMGTAFVDAAAYERALAQGGAVSPQVQYIITFSQGDNFFTIQPRAKADVVNLNVPYQGRIIVLILQPVETPTEATASLILVDKPKDEEAAEPAPGCAHSSPAGSGAQGIAIATPTPTPIIEKVAEMPESPRVPVTVPRLDGFLSKLAIVHAAAPGPELQEISKAMGLAVAISVAEDPKRGAIPNPVNDQKALQIILLRTARDPKLDAVGFIVLLRNTSEKPVDLDPGTFSARCGDAFYTAAIADAPVHLDAKESRPAYFAIAGTGDGRPNHMAADNAWRISVAEVPAQ